MAEPSRYSVGGDEADIFKNKLNITDLKMLEDIETLLLSDAYQRFFEIVVQEDMPCNLGLLFEIHRFFLAPLYTWAGMIRTVEISKDSILFAPSSQINVLLSQFEKLLSENMPKVGDSKTKVAEKLALIHCEFNAIHPFREGNGRTIRLFLDLIAAKNGFGIIDYSDGEKKTYIAACIQGMQKNYKPMELLLFKGLKKQSSE